MRVPDWQSDDGRIRLWCGDCLELLPQLEPGSVDAVVTDPPYGTKTDQRDEWMVGEFSNVMPLVLPMLRKSLVGNGAFYCFTSWQMMAEWLLRYQQYFRLQNILVWDKGQHSGCYSPFAWQFTWEGIFFGIKGRRNTRKYMPDVIRSSQGGKRAAMEKPVDVCEQLIEASTEPNETVCDPFFGTGSTGVACARTGRQFVGMEIEPRLFATAVRRIEAELNRAPLFKEQERQAEMFEE